MLRACSSKRRSNRLRRIPDNLRPDFVTFSCNTRTKASAITAMVKSRSAAVFFLLFFPDQTELSWKYNNLLGDRLTSPRGDISSKKSRHRSGKSCHSNGPPCDRHGGPQQERSAITVCVGEVKETHGLREIRVIATHLI